MSNEELVIKIKQNINSTENLEELYKNNLPFLRSICKNYTKYEEMEDLMQIAYLGIYEAVKRFEPEYGYKFMTYARWWIIREISTHISENSLVKIPQSKREEIIKYKKAVEFLTNEYKRLPTDEEIAYYMKISEDNAKQLRTLTKRIESLDGPLSDENNATISDTLQCDFDLENDVIDKIIDEKIRSELWGFIEDKTSVREVDIIKKRYINEYSLQKIGDEYGMTRERVRQILANIFRVLHRSKTMREIAEKFEVAYSNIYHTGIGNFERNFSSQVERTAIRLYELDMGYEEIKAEYLKKRGFA